MGGLAAPTSGHVQLAGTRIYDLATDARAALRRTEIGFVFHTFNLVPYLTCLENVMVPALLAGRSRAQAAEAAGSLLERFGLSARRRHRPAQLSVSERQRVGIARAMVNAPRLLLADEPTGNLDPATAEQVMDVLHELNDRGQTVVVVTHDLRLAEGASRVVRLRSGRIEEDRRGLRRELASLCLAIASHLDASERRVELATLAALGATRRTILGAVVLRSGLVAIAGASVGLAAGAALACAQDGAAAAALARAWPAWAILVLVAFSVGTVAAVPVAMAASLRDPVPDLQEQ